MRVQIIPFRIRFFIEIFFQVPEKKEVNIGIGFLPDFKRVVHVLYQQQKCNQQHADDKKEDQAFVKRIKVYKK